MIDRIQKYSAIIAWLCLILLTDYKNCLTIEHNHYEYDFTYELKPPTAPIWAENITAYPVILIPGNFR
jgi:hypothetical protein